MLHQKRLDLQETASLSVNMCPSVDSTRKDISILVAQSGQPPDDYQNGVTLASPTNPIIRKNSGAYPWCMVGNPKRDTSSDDQPRDNICHRVCVELVGRDRYQAHCCGVEAS